MSIIIPYECCTPYLFGNFVFFCLHFLLMARQVEVRRRKLAASQPYGPLKMEISIMLTARRITQLPCALRENPKITEFKVDNFVFTHSNFRRPQFTLCSMQNPFLTLFLTFGSTSKFLRHYISSFFSSHSFFTFQKSTAAGS